MKKKLLASVVAGLGFVGAAHAVHVNPDGLGQVLLYPYYTVQGGYDTYVHVVNTTTEAKAVKVRFLEGKNSREVLDFNLYLSPNDEWTGMIARSANGAVLTTKDTSCTAPAIPAAGVEFRNFEFTGDSVNTTARTREGYLEIIEMGDVKNAALVTAITHVDGVPADCAAVRTAARTGGALNSGAPAVEKPSGGLYGFNTLINVNEGSAHTLDAVALDDFVDSVAGISLHTEPGSLTPSLAQVGTDADILDGSTIIGYAGAQPIDNVSALIMRSSVINDYVLAPEIAGKTDWVMTFPTKRFYVNSPDLAPFAEAWNSATSTSCDPIEVQYFDREERAQGATPDDFSPKPVAGVLSLCNEVNTLTFLRSGSDEGSVFSAEFTNQTVTLDSGFDNGWARIGFTADAATMTDGTTTINGLPVIGFSAMNFTNGTLQVEGVNTLSNYGGSSVHKGERDIQQ